MNTRTFGGGLLSLTAFLLACGPVSAGAIFDYAGVPNHSGHVSWDDGVPHFHQHHFHKAPDAGNDAVAGHDHAHELSGTRTNEPHYDPYAVWVNETFMVFDGSGGGAAQEFFSHGFIIENNVNTPEYRFDSNFTLFDHNGNAFDARPQVRSAFSTWSGINVDDPHLYMGLRFREVTNDGDAAEITVRAVDHIAGAVARFIPGTRVLEFRRFVDAALTTKHQWYTGANQAGLANNINVDDYLTVALHEVGHIVGLDHQNDNDDIMHTLAGRGDIVNGGGVFRSLSQDDILGARDLYSIPTPEPMSVALLGLGVAGFAGMGLRRRKMA